MDVIGGCTETVFWRRPPGAVPRMGRGHRQVSPRRREAETTLLKSEPGPRELRNLKPGSWAINAC